MGEPLFTEEEATAIGEAAAQKVAKLHRRRLVTQSALAGFITACAIAIPTTLVLNRDTEDVGRQNAQRNCQAAVSARPQGNARAFDQVSFLAIMEDVFTPAHPKKPQPPQLHAFAVRELAHINARLSFWRNYTALPGNGNELPKQITSFGQLAATIHPLPLVNCAHQVKG